MINSIEKMKYSFHVEYGYHDWIGFIFLDLSNHSKTM